MPTGDAAAQQQQEEHKQEKEGVLRVGDFVERDIDGIWFPAKVLAVHQRSHGSGSSDQASHVWRRQQLAYDLVYLDDENRESEVPEEDIRAVCDDGTKPKEGAHSVLGGENADMEGGVRCEGGGGVLEGFGAQEEKGDAGADQSLRWREGERIQKFVHDLDDSNTGSSNNHGDQQEGPKVTIHSSHGTFDTKEDGSANAYIINGPETNVAAGSGLRGIRWLRGPS